MSFRTQPRSCGLGFSSPCDLSLLTSAQHSVCSQMVTEGVLWPNPTSLLFPGSLYNSTGHTAGTTHLALDQSLVLSSLLRTCVSPIGKLQGCKNQVTYVHTNIVTLLHSRLLRFREVTYSRSITQVVSDIEPDANRGLSDSKAYILNRFAKLPINMQ